MSDDLGVMVKKSENFSEWYLEIVRKAGFVDQRAPIKGMDVFAPWGYAAWEQFVKVADGMFKENGVKNCYFPMLIPVSFYKREAKHFEGFNPELVKITEVNGEKLKDPIALRTTSETIIYHMFSQWIRSYRDLPFKINQWCNIVRWETKMTKPLVRPREFLWQEGHTAHASREDAFKQVEEIRKIYLSLHHDTLCLPVMCLKRTDADKFAGAEMTMAFDMCVPDGKIIQGATDHLLNQKFPKAFDVTFEDRDNKPKYVWTTSWGLSEREIGAMIMMHGDDNGAVLPPSISPYQAVIIPILFKDSAKKVIKAAEKLKKDLEKAGIRVYLDSRDEYSAGFKFNEWELKGVPLRIEIGPRDLKKKQFMYARRDDGKKGALKLSEAKKVSGILDLIQKGLFKKAKTFLKSHITDAKSMKDVKKILDTKGGFIRTNWCGSPKCEELVKDETGGAEIRGSLYGKDEKTFGKCFYCGKKASDVIYIAKAY